MAKTEWFDITLPLNKEIPLPPAMPPRPGQPPPLNPRFPWRRYTAFSMWTRVIK